MNKHFLILITVLSLSISVYPQNSFSVSTVGAGEPIIFLPSLGCPGEMWNETVKDFSDNYKCYMISIDGFAGKPSCDSFSISNICNEFAEFIKKEKLGKPILVGHSFGGFVALNIASLFPELFSKLIIVDAVPFALGRVNLGFTIEQAKQQAAAIKLMISQLSDDSFRKKQAETVQLFVSDSSKQKQILNWFVTTNRAVFAEAQSEMIANDLRESIKKIKIPTLVMATWKSLKPYGISREMTEQNIKTQYSNVENCSVIISDTNHFIMYDDPAWFIHQLKEFLAK